MPRSSGFSVQNQFTRGLITEATGYNFPEDAATATDNCVFEKTGEVRRRLGIDFEDGYKIYEAEGDIGGVSEFVWNQVGEDGRRSLICIQLGSEISFYEVDAYGNVGDNKKDFSVNLIAYRIAGAPNPRFDLCQFAAGFGYLFVTHPFCNPIRVEYSYEDDNITIEEITIEIRDVEGIDDGLGVSTRPSTLSKEHKYNLFNQGWFANAVGPKHDSRDFETNVVVHWNAIRGNYPSNADIWFLHKHVNIDNGKEEFDPDPDRNPIDLGNTPAPKGHYIMYAFNQQRSTVVEADYAINRVGGIKDSQDKITNFGGIPNVTSGYHRPATVAFYAGRVWYAGVNHSEFSQKVYFSQVVEDADKVGRCFSHNDPTNEDFSDLLDTDGGVINIAEAAEIIKLLPIRNQLIVFATNGIWAISGGQGAGFLATDYAIDKISNVGAISFTNMVTVEGLPQWWNYNGIYGLFPDDAGITLQVRSLSDDSIRTYFLEDIPVTSRRYAKGAYNPVTKVIQWVWRDATTLGFINNFIYNRILNLNIETGAYYPWSINDNNVDIIGIFTIDNAVGVRSSETVKDNDGNIVVDAAGNEVTTRVNTNTVTESKFKYILNVDTG